MVRFLLFVLAAGVTALTVAGMWLFLRQDTLIHFPERVTPEKMEKLAREEGFIPWENSAGKRIGWQSIGGDPARVLLFFHGNGKHALHRNYLSYRLRSKDHWKTFLLEYPGYGDRKGTSTEKSLTAAALEAFDLLAGVPGRKIYLLGQSLGSGVACALAAQRSTVISGIVLITPFNKFSAAAKHQKPLLAPFTFLLRTQFNSEANLQQYPGPVAFVLAEQDDSVPAALGEILYQAYPGLKKSWMIPAAGHGDAELFMDRWPEIVTWLAAESPR